MTDKTRVVHIKDNIPDAVYIGRAMPRQGLKASKWANPYKIGAPSSKNSFAQTCDIMGRDTVIRRYRLDLIPAANGYGGPKRYLLADLPELREKPLACWCRHDGEERTSANECHGDILVALLDANTDDELRALAAEAK